MATGISSSMAQERRRHPRVTHRISCDLQNEQQALKAETLNLSACGAYCTVQEFIPPMTKLQVSLTLPHGKSTSHVNCTGVVVRVEPMTTNLEHWKYRIAIWFSDLSDRNRSAISHFVEQRLAESSSSP